MKQLELRISTRLLMVSALVIGATLLISGATRIAQSANLSTTLNASSNTSDNNFDDGYNELPPGLQGFSYSTLVVSGLVHPRPASTKPVTIFPPSPSLPFSNVSWGNPVNISNYPVGTHGSTEPSAAMHPTDPLLALSGGNWQNGFSSPTAIVRIENSNTGGNTWTGRFWPNNCPQSADGVAVWANQAINGGHTALYSGLCMDASIIHVQLSKSTDAGSNWGAITNTNVDNDSCPPAQGPCTHDREYLWTDHNPTSPYYGRTYITEVVASNDPDKNNIPSNWTVGLRWTTDQGTTWSTYVPLNTPYEYQQLLNINEFASLAIEPNGHIVEVWRRGRGLVGNVAFGDTDKVMWARSTDGGSTFTTSDSSRVYTVPTNQSIIWNTASPGGFRWSDAPNVAADPVNGYLYAVWLQYRTPSTPESAAVYLSKSTDEGNTWSTPVIPYNNPNPNLFQYFPWVQVSNDHVVHVTFSGAVGNNTTAAHFYVQSTDGGASFSPPFQLSSTYATQGFMGDYEAMSIGGNSNGQETVMTTWTQSNPNGGDYGNDRWGRFGTFGTGQPTPTPTQCTTNPNYNISVTANATIVPGTTDIQNHTDNGVTFINLPFNYTLYDQSFNTAIVGSNGTLGFAGNGNSDTNACLPTNTMNYAILPYWDNLYTNNPFGGCDDCGVYTSTSGNAPNRIFNIEWKACEYDPNASAGPIQGPQGAFACGTGGTVRVDFEVQLYEGQTRFDAIYGGVPYNGLVQL